MIHLLVQVEEEEGDQVAMVVMVVVDQVALIQEGVEGVNPKITLLVQVILVIF